MGVKEDIQQKKRATMNARARDAIQSVPWPSHVTDTDSEWELRMKGRCFQ